MSTTTNPPTEKQVTEQRNGGIGPTPADGTPGGKVSAEVRNWSQTRETVAPDFDFDTNPDPRPAGSPTADQPQQTNPQGEPPASQVADGIKIVFKGREEVIPVDKAATMLQQFRNIDEQYGPYHVLARQLKEAGVDPARGAQLLVEAYNKTFGANTRPTGTNPADNVTAAPAAAPAAAISDDQAAEKAKEITAQMGVNNPDFEQAVANILKHGSTLAQLAGTVPSLVNDVNRVKQAHVAAANNAHLTSINQHAEAVASELGINDEANFTEFQAWVQDLEQTIPGTMQGIMRSPQAVEKAIRLFAEQKKGREAQRAADALRQQVNNDRARAGGEAVTPAGRGGAAPGAAANKADAQKAFNDEMLAAL